MLEVLVYVVINALLVRTSQSVKFSTLASTDFRRKYDCIQQNEENSDVYFLALLNMFSMKGLW